MDQSAITVDAVIIGGGLVGGVMAVVLADAGLAVAVIDAEDPQLILSQPFDGRTSAIAAAGRRMLDAVGIWSDIAPHAGRIDEIRIADGASSLFLHYDHRLLGDEALGFVVENRVVRQALFARFQTMPNIAHFAPAKIDFSRLRQDSHFVHVALEDGREIQAKLVIGADGRASRTRRHAGIGVTRWNYDQTAIVCTVRHARPHHNVAHEHFLPAGPFAILPLPDHQSSIVWTEKSHLVKPIIEQSHDDFLTELKTRFGTFLGDLDVVGPRWSYPLSLQHAHSYIAPRLALIGDAAHGMHPIAGQGFNMGLRDVAALAEKIVEAKRTGIDIGGVAVLEGYQRWRRFDTMAMLAVTDILNRLYSNDIAPLRLARDLGMAAVNKIPALKKLFMRHAMGLEGDLPRLLRGERL